VQAMSVMARDRENRRYLPGFTLPELIVPCADLAQTLTGSDCLLLAVPSGGFRALLREVKYAAPAMRSVIWASKGLELPDGRGLHRVIEEELGSQISHALLSGPSFAREVAQGKPTAVTMAAFDPSFAREAAGWFHGGGLRVYTSEDVIGVELGGALKNVLAIAAGISDGLGFGANARSALIPRGLYELTLLGTKAGARRETLSGLSGLGDLVLTCTDDQSRNRRLGLALARGESREAAARAIGQVVEGMETARVVQALARDHGVEMPICTQVYRVLYEGLAPRRAVMELLARDARAENH
jgi:glycerol-3-phosphate dehydrogenase (NAD(P)+)